MTNTTTPATQATAMSTEDRLALDRWHLDRYDRLRASTAMRAGVVLSAGALLSAANVLIISELLGTGTRPLPDGVLVGCTVIAFAGAVLVVLAVIRAAGVLVTLRDSRSLFDRGRKLPSSPLFNGTDTVRDTRSFEQFASMIAGQSVDDAIQAAEVELWLCIHQHRHRYTSLRRAVRSLRWAAIAVPISLAVLIVAELSYRT